jgi:hypothetical protein
MNPESPEGQAHMDKLEEEIQKLPIAKEMREKIEKGEEWYETRTSCFIIFFFISERKK